jgi:membrane fusion protein, multidrug efflux system
MAEQAAHANDTPGEEARSTDETAPAKRKLSGRAKIILIALALGALVGIAIWYLRYESHGKYLQDTNDAQVRADMVVVAPRVAG